MATTVTDGDLSIAMAPGDSVVIELPSGMDQTGTWKIHDDNVGWLVDYSPGPVPGKKVYWHGNLVAAQQITYTTQTEYCVLNIIAMLPHDHSDVYRGGPAFGVYKSVD